MWKVYIDIAILLRYIFDKAQKTHPGTLHTPSIKSQTLKNHLSATTNNFLHFYTIFIQFFIFFHVYNTFLVIHACQRQIANNTQSWLWHKNDAVTWLFGIYHFEWCVR